MNMNVPLTQRVEILFWDFVINTLTTSEFVRRNLPRIYRLLEPRVVRQALLLVLAASAAGFITGFIVNLYVLAR
ncbi:hypothetical protein FDZ74_03095 [bacterium]|nr:MAG: hypothetical protein FDZ74_03095 [bacterium]